MSIKVLMVTELFPPNCTGGGWSTYNLAKALNESDEVEVKVLAVNQEKVKQDVPVEKISVKRFPNELAYAKIKEEVDERKDDFDIIQGQHSLTIPPLGQIEDKPTVGVIRDYWPVCYKTTLRDNFGNNHLKCGAKCLFSTIQDFTWKFPYKVWNHNFRKYLTKRIDVLAARSRFVEERLQDHGFSLTEVHHNFIEEGFTDNVEPKGEGDILFVGSLGEHKGPQLLVEAIPEILEEKAERKFVFLGKGELMESLKRRVEELGVQDSVEFKGHVPMEEVKSRMKGASVMVSPSMWYEPLSRVILESQALGTPVITTDRGGNSEAVDEEMVFDPDKENLAGRIISVLNGEVEQDLKYFRSDEIVGKWIDTYKSMIDGN